MEIVLTVLITVAVVWKLGLFKPIVVLSNTAVRETSLYDAEHKVASIQRYKTLELDEEDVIKAANNKATLDNFNFD